MDWTQIETKWAAMTRRVRADWTIDTSAGKGLRAPAGMAVDKALGTIATPRPAAPAEQRAVAQLATRKPLDAGTKTLAE